MLAVWCYSLCRIEPGLDEIVDRFYFETVGPYWPKERALVDDGYRSLAFPFDEFSPPDLTIELTWNLNDLISYLQTWSPVRRYIERHGRDPVADVASELAPAWGNPEDEKLVRWPIHMRIGRVPPLG